MLTAICFSDLCNYSVNRGSNAKGTQKEVSRSAVKCPDCGHSLYWTRKKSASQDRHSTTKSEKKSRQQWQWI